MIIYVKIKIKKHFLLILLEWKNDFEMKICIFASFLYN